MCSALLRVAKLGRSVVSNSSIFTGRVSSSAEVWKRILVKPSGSTVSLHFTGDWRVNRNWGMNVDYKGHPTYRGGPNYRGRNLPEGCVLIRINNNLPTYATSLPFTIGPDVSGDIYLACNDELAGLDDNFGSINYKITYEPFASIEE